MNGINEQQALASWICPSCSEELGELNAYCLYCKINSNLTIYNPDKFFLRDIRLPHIHREITQMIDNSNDNLTDEQRIELIESNQRMTPQEKLHAKLFYHETILVRDMDTLTLRAHREELEKIAFEAKTRSGAARNEENRREKLTAPKGPTGFSRSINDDSSATEAINTIKERQKKLTGKEKIKAGLATMYMQGGMSQVEANAEAEKAMSAGAILARIKDQKSKDILTGKNEQKVEEVKTTMINPFEKK